MGDKHLLREREKAAKKNGYPFRDNSELDKAAMKQKGKEFREKRLAANRARVGARHEG